MRREALMITAIRTAIPALVKRVDSFRGNMVSDMASIRDVISSAGRKEKLRLANCP